MIRRQISEAISLDDEHSEASVYPPLRRRHKWMVLKKPDSEHFAPRSWHRFGVELVDIRTALKERSSDEEVFQRAAAKVDQRIRMDPKVLGGAPCIAGTRIPVYAILQLVEAGYSHKRILKSFPSLSAEDLEAALRFSAIVMER